MFDIVGILAFDVPVAIVLLFIWRPFDPSSVLGASFAQGRRRLAAA
jgi:hypothetical protein